MSRIYKVKTPTGERLVDANTKGQAIGHCVDKDYSAEVVGASEMYSLIQAGAKVEKAEVKSKAQKFADNVGKPSAPQMPVPTPEQQANINAAVAGETKQPSASTASAPSAPQPQAQPSTAAPVAGGATPAPFIPPAAAKPADFAPGVNPVLAEQQRINPKAAEAAGAPKPILPPAGAAVPPAAPSQGGPVDWEAREQG